jgi:uncharacterized protein YlxP (DUF503 family)
VTSEPCIGILLAELHFPGCRSLKDKRRPLVSLRDTVQGRYRASFSEVGHQESWQLADVLIVVAGSSVTQARDRLNDIDRYLHSHDFEVARIIIKTVAPVQALWPDDF